MQITFRCKQCNKVFNKNLSKPQTTIKCDCGCEAIRTFGNIATDKESDNVSHAIEMMKYATNPSGKQKTII
jgi:hypothetical protein